VVDHLEEESSFNFPKLHLMIYFRWCIEQFGGLQQWSTEVGEAAHKTQIKDGYRASNKTGDIYRQIVNYYLHRDAFAVRRMNLNANGFSNGTSRPPQLDVSYLTAATGGSGGEGSKMKRQVLLGSIQKGVTMFGDIGNSYSHDNILQSCLVNSTLAYWNASKIYINIDNLRTC
jgi:hypothetical protein